MLAHYYNVLIGYCFSYNISQFQLFRKGNVIMLVKHAKFSLLCWCIASSVVKLGSYDERNLLNW